MLQETLTYEADGLAMNGQLFLEPSQTPRPGILIFPEAFGLNDNALERAKRLVAQGYVALACDLHGDGRVFEALTDAMAELQPLFDDPLRTRARALAALEALRGREEVDTARIAAIGFCFPMPLELARSGVDLRAVVGFHTGLGTKAPTIAPSGIKAKVLVCIGADDPFITPDDRAAFEAEMRAGGTDWEMELYGGTVHGFTSRDAGRRNMPEAIRYNPEADARAWASALDLFSRALA